MADTPDKIKRLGHCFSASFLRNRRLRQPVMRTLLSVFLATGLPVLLPAAEGPPGSSAALDQALRDRISDLDTALTPYREKLPELLDFAKRNQMWDAFSLGQRGRLRFFSGGA